MKGLKQLVLAACTLVTIRRALTRGRNRRRPDRRRTARHDMEAFRSWFRRRGLVTVVVAAAVCALTEEPSDPPSSESSGPPIVVSVSGD